MGKKQSKRQNGNHERKNGKLTHHWLVETRKRNQQGKSKSSLQNRKVIQWYSETVKKLQAPRVGNNTNVNIFNETYSEVDQEDDDANGLSPPTVTSPPSLSCFGCYSNDDSFEREASEDGSTLRSPGPFDPQSLMSENEWQSHMTLKITSLEQRLAVVEQRLIDCGRKRDVLLQELFQELDDDDEDEEI